MINKANHFGYVFKIKFIFSSSYSYISTKNDVKNNLQMPSVSIWMSMNDEWITSTIKIYVYKEFGQLHVESQTQPHDEG